MAKKNEVRTLSVILNEANVKAAEYNNLREGDPARADLDVAVNNLVKEYNELSLLTVYAKCMATELPIKTFAETYSWNRLSRTIKPTPVVLPDGSKLKEGKMSLNDSDAVLELSKFIKWAADSNHQITHSKDWEEKVREANKAIKAEWKKFFASNGDTHSMSKRKLKAAMQNMFDALIFIPTAKGENSVVANAAVANLVFGGANKLNTTADISDKHMDVLPDNYWKILQMLSLNMAVTGKELLVDYNEGEEVPASEPAKTEEPAKTKAEKPANESKVKADKTAKSSK